MGKWREDWDGAWKHVLEHHLKELLEFGFPDIYSQIDWSVAVEILNTELLPDNHQEAGYRSHVDCLVRLALKKGQSIVLHVEVQGWKVSGFNHRMFDYNCYLTRYYGDCVISLLILADAEPHWRPNRYERELLGQRMTFSVPCLKVLDYPEEELLLSTHPAAFLLLASQKALATRRGKGRFERRLQYKQELTVQLLSGSYDEEQVARLFHSLDWLLALPSDKELQFRQWKNNLTTKSSTHTMKLYTLVSLAREEGTIHGQAVALRRLLVRKFGRGVIQLSWVKEKLASATQKDLEQWLEQILDAHAPEEVFTTKARGHKDF